MAETRLPDTADDRGARADHGDAAGFHELGVPPTLVRALTKSGITSPFPIQTATLPDALAGRDVLGRGQTGSGKTLAFVLPMLARLAATDRPTPARQPRALILAPTRELARQILQVIEPLARPLDLRATVIFGGVAAGPQVSALRRGVDIIVACPGRLEDLLRSNATTLRSIDITVLDEADHMADLGFLPAVRRLLDLTPAGGQRLLFSATLDNAVDVLVRRYLSDPVVHSVDDDDAPALDMAHHVLHIAAAERLGVLVDLTSAPGRSVVFTRTKHRAKQLTRQLVAAGVPAVEMHGNLSQAARVRNLDAFSRGTATALIATDIAARGLHIDDVELVIHADPPIEHKAYLHRSGRTARAGAAGTVVTLATEEQRIEVAKLGRKAGVHAVVTQHRPGQPVLGQLGDPAFAGAPVSTGPSSSTPSAGRAQHRARGRRRSGR